jgi:hypothetical protein
MGYRGRCPAGPAPSRGLLTSSTGIPQVRCSRHLPPAVQASGAGLDVIMPPRPGESGGAALVLERSQPALASGQAAQSIADVGTQLVPGQNGRPAALRLRVVQ